jgi:hypothetical protein
MKLMMGRVKIMQVVMFHESRQSTKKHVSTDVDLKRTDRGMTVINRGKQQATGGEQIMHLMSVL